MLVPATTIALDVTTLFVVATCVACLLGVLLLIASAKSGIHALAWWGAAYLIGGLSVAAWSLGELVSPPLPTGIPNALMFVACGAIWSAARVFHGRPALVSALLAGAAAWLLACMFTDFAQWPAARIALSAGIVASYTFATAMELARERRRSLRRRWPALLGLLDRQARKGASVSALMFDLDHFKSINDSFGHATGDQALRLFALTASASTRATDVVGRFGGEEFVALLPVPLSEAKIVAERVRKAFETVGVTVAGCDLKATVSIGAAAGQPGTDVVALLAAADAALYRAKANGRNRVEAVKDGEMPTLFASTRPRIPADQAACRAAPIPPRPLEFLVS